MNWMFLFLLLRLCRFICGMAPPFRSDALKYLRLRGRSGVAVNNIK